MHGFYNRFVWHDSGISPQIHVFQLYSLITQKIRNVNKVEPFTYYTMVTTAEPIVNIGYRKRGRGRRRGRRRGERRGRDRRGGRQRG